MQTRSKKFSKAEVKFETGLSSRARDEDDLYHLIANAPQRDAQPHTANLTDQEVGEKLCSDY